MVAIHIFHKLLICAHLFMNMTSWGYCVLVYKCSPFCSPEYLRDLSDWLGCDPSLKLLLPLRRRMSGKGALDKVLSRLLLRVTFSLIYIVDLFLVQWFIILVFASHAELAPRVRKRWRINWGRDWWSTESTPHAVVTRRLVSLVAGFSLTSPKLSTVGVEVGS